MNSSTNTEDTLEGQTMRIPLFEQIGSLYEEEEDDDDENLYVNEAYRVELKFRRNNAFLFAAVKFYFI